MHPQCTFSEGQLKHVSARGHTNSMSLDRNLLRRQSRNGLSLRTRETQGKKTQMVRHLQRATLSAYQLIFWASSQVSFRLLQRQGCSFCLPEPYILAAAFLRGWLAMLALARQEASCTQHMCTHRMTRGHHV